MAANYAAGISLRSEDRILNFKHSWNAIGSSDSDSQFQLVQQVQSTWEDLAILRF